MADWVVVGLEPGTFWPTTETKVAYRGHELVLRPQTGRFAPDVAFQCSGGMTFNDGMLLLRQFLSAIAWVIDSPFQEIMVTGGSHPIHVGNSTNEPPRRSPLAPRFPLKYVLEPSDPKALLALAFYREALNVNSTSYTFLGFFKILNILHATHAEQEAWINRVVDHVEGPVAQARLAELRETTGNVGKYLVYSGRCAVAHAYAQPLVNPEDPQDTQRLETDLPLIQALAQHLIEHELGVRSRHTIWREHLYELDGFRALLGEPIVARLKNRGSVKPEELPPLRRLSIRLRDYDVFPALERLRPHVVGPSVDGRVILRCVFENGGVRVTLSLNFVEERLELNPQRGLGLADDGSPEAMRQAADVVRFLKGLVLNGALEVWDAEHAARLGRCDPFIPKNIDLTATARNLDREVEQFLSVAAAREKGPP